MRCEKCGFISFEYNNSCPSCGAGLSSLRRSMNIYWEKPETDFHKLFDETLEPSVDFIDHVPTDVEEGEAELDFGVDDDFEFSLDD